MRFSFAFILLAAILLVGCQNPNSQASNIQEADLLVYNAQIYTVDPDFKVVEAMAISEGKVVATGTVNDFKGKFTFQDSLNAQGKFIYPGLNDAHAHLFGYAEGLSRVNLVGTQSYKEVLQRLVEFTANKDLDFIEGRGWDQNDWPDQAFPHREALDSLFPHTPVKLARIDGHAALVNSAALKYAGVDGNAEVSGGALLKENGELTGVLIDNAVDLVQFPKMEAQQMKEALMVAQENLWAHGITSLTDAGLKKEQIAILQELYEEGRFLIRVNAMVADDSASLDHFLKQGPISNEQLRVHSVKFYLDGALGSRGALMLEPYADDPNNYGLQLRPRAYFQDLADSLAALGWQMCVHAIGDSANRLAIDVFQQALAGKEDHRWRIEHAQIVHPQDLNEMVAAGIIPSTQPTHATSDMYWVEQRLGADRMERAYPAADYLRAGAKLPLGTDFPVEDINPLYTLRAATLRQDAEGQYFDRPGADQRLNFESALRGMTIWGAYASFEEERKGSLEVGKLADFVIYDFDLAKASLEQLNTAKPKATFINGKQVY
jgi:hypothetical protein